MGEKDEKKNEIKKEDECTTVVLKLELHCEGCAKKVRRSISNLEGVEKVKSDCKAKKLNVTGSVDPTWLREVVETKTKKKVELISPPPPKNDAASGGAAAAEKKPDQKKIEENKTDHIDDNKKPKEAAVSSVVMKTKLHCDDCANKIKRIILKNFEGVDTVKTDLHKDLIMVTGASILDPEKLVTYLREKLKRGVDIITIPLKKDNAAAAAGDDRKEKLASGEITKEAAKLVEVVNKMEHHSNYINNSQTHYAMPMPMYNQSYNDDHHHGMVMPHPNTGYIHGPPPLPPPTYLESDHMFSDENPNGCSLM